MKRTRTACQGLLLFVVCVAPVLLPSPCAASDVAPVLDPEETGLFCVQLVVPDRVSAEVELEVAAIELRGEINRSTRLPVEIPRLASRELAGRAPVWIDTAVEPDLYHVLVIDFDVARVRVDRAWTDADSSALRVELPLERRIAAGEGTVLALRWEVDALAVDDPGWRPVFTAESTPLPALGERAYVAQSGSGSVGVIDRNTGRLAAVLPTGGEPTDVAWAEAARRLFVSVAGMEELVAYDVGEMNVPRRLPLRYGDDPRRVLVSDDEQRVAVLCAQSSTIVMVSAFSLVETDRFNVAPRPVAMAEDPRSGRLFVTSELAGEVTVLDPRGGDAPTVIGGLDAPREIAYLARENRFAVSVARGRRIELRDARSGAVLETLELCGPVRSMAHQHRSGRLYAALAGCDQIAVLRPDQAVEIDREPLPGAPALVTLDPEDRHLLVPVPELGQVVSLRTTRAGSRTLYWTGRGPSAVVVP